MYTACCFDKEGSGCYISLLSPPDVIVVGGGPAGIGAALASARNGAKTILIERFGSLGGMQSQAMSSSFSLVDPEIQGGIIHEVIRRLRDGGAILRDTSDRTRAATFTVVSFNCEYYKYLLDHMMLESGVKLLYHTFGVGGIREGNLLKGIIIECIQLWKLLKDNVHGFENSSVEKLGTIPILRDTHRIIGEYILTEEDMYQGRAFNDSVAVSNMGPDIYGPDGEHEYRLTLPHDIPYRCLVSRDIENLMAAGATLSADFYAWAADRYSAPSICTGQASGTAAAQAVKAGVSPKKLGIKKVQKTLRKQGIPVTVKDLPGEVIEAYQKRLELEKTLTRL